MTKRVVNQGPVTNQTTVIKTKTPGFFSGLNQGCGCCFGVIIVIIIILVLIGSSLS